MIKTKKPMNRITSILVILTFLFNILIGISLFQENVNAETYALDFEEENETISYFAYAGSNITIDENDAYNGKKSIKVTNRNSI